uniref:Reverse transcriptase Ty1/copia-type domain-containing protein n=1 Tax=Chenopodium quinoa TaxID=63459 RepID=A0A803KNI7_CHEQI
MMQAAGNFFAKWGSFTRQAVWTDHSKMEELKESTGTSWKWLGFSEYKLEFPCNTRVIVFKLLYNNQQTPHTSLEPQEDVKFYETICPYKLFYPNSKTQSEVVNNTGINIDNRGIEENGVETVEIEPHEEEEMEQNVDQPDQIDHILRSEEEPVYVDDLIVAGNDMEEIFETKLFLTSQFHMKDMGELRYFLGIEVDRSEQGMFLSQRKYVADILEEYDMVNLRPLKLPMDPHLKLTAEGGSILRDPEPYQKLVEKLIYRTITRPDISFTVHVLSKFMHKPTYIHLQCAKRVLRYLSGSTQQGILASYIQRKC